MPETKEWTITIDSWGGFAPAYFENENPYLGNKNQASDMRNIDITDPNVLTQGPGLIDLIDVQERGAISLMKGILKIATPGEVSYGIGGKVLHQITPSTVVYNDLFPHIITKTGATRIDGEDVCFYKGKTFYTYNHLNGGDIGMFDGTEFDDDWGSTIPANAEELINSPHQMINGGDDEVYFTNGNYVGKILYDDEEEQFAMDDIALDFWEDSETASLTWNNNRIAIAVNRPNIPGSNFAQSGIYSWNGTSSSWEGDPIEINGKIGALYTKNGVTFVWWQDGADVGAYNLGYISGLQLHSIKRFKGSLPLYYQVGEYKGFVSWVSDGKIFLWGAKDPEVSVTMSQYCSGKYSIVGGVASPFGRLLISSVNI